MHLLARVLTATSVVVALVALSSVPARAQVVPSWLPGLSIKLLVRTIEFKNLVKEEIRERLERRPLIFPRPVPPPAILPPLDLPLDPAPTRAAPAHTTLRPELVP
jgi:hypothetical protein